MGAGFKEFRRRFLGIDWAGVEGWAGNSFDVIVGELSGQDFSQGDARGLARGGRHFSRRFLSLSALALIGGYVVARYFIYGAMAVRSVETWFWRDTIMNVPRVVGFLVCVFLLRGMLSVRDEFRAGSGRAVGGGLVLIGIWVWHLSGYGGEEFSGWMIFGGVISSLIVGFWEEFAFRGMVQGILMEWFGRMGVVMIGSALFTVYHVQAQSVWAWIPIFLTGVIFANLRFAGGTLLTLSLAHGIADSFYFVFGSEGPGVESSEQMIFMGMLGMVAVGSFGVRRAAREG